MYIYVYRCFKGLLEGDIDIGMGVVLDVDMNMDALGPVGLK